MNQPPLSLIVEIQQKFAARGIHSVVGGSAVLASLGLVEEVQDWDLLTDAAPEAVQEVLEALECRYERLGPAGVFRSAGLFRVSAEDHAIRLSALQGQGLGVGFHEQDQRLSVEIALQLIST